MPTEQLPPTQQNIDEKLDRVLVYLARMDRRDRIRMWGGFLHTLLTVVPLILFLVSSWYVYANFVVIMTEFTHRAAENAASATGQRYDDALRQIQKAFGIKQAN